MRRVRYFAYAILISLPVLGCGGGQEENVPLTDEVNADIQRQDAAVADEESHL